MHVTCEISASELAHWRRVASPGMRFRGALNYVTIFSLIGLPGTCLLAAFGAWSALAVATGCLVCGAVAFIVWQRRIQQSHLHRLRKLTVCAGPQSLRSEADPGWTEWDWSHARKVMSSGAGLLIVVGKSSLLPVFKQAFSTEEAFEQFAQVVRREVAAARLSSPRFQPAIPAPQASTNEQTPGDMQVTYQPDPKREFDYMEARHSTNPKQVSFPRSIGTAFPWAFLAVVIMFAVEDAHWLLVSVVGLVAYFVFNLALFSAAGPIQRIIMRWGLDSLSLDSRTLTISTAGLSFVGPTWRSFSTWASLGRAENHPREVVLYYLQGRTPTIIPLAAFASASDADEFVRAVHAFQALAKRQERSAGVLTVVDDDSGQPPDAI